MVRTEREHGQPRFVIGDRVFTTSHGLGTIEVAMGWNHTSTNAQRRPTFEYIVRIHHTGARIRCRETELSKE